MLRFGPRCYYHLHPFHSAIVPPGVRPRTVVSPACSAAVIISAACNLSSSTGPLFACRENSHRGQTTLRVQGIKSGPLPSSLLYRGQSLAGPYQRMRDLVHISSLGTSAALAANASPQKPDKAIGAENTRVAGQPLVGSTDEVYQEAVRKLNTLQSNAKTLDAIRKNRDLGAYRNIPDVIDFTSRVGISLDRLDDLSCIHVAGTKGKGSVCAFTESILRASGFRTGFYSSPHLVEVRERIRINGQPLPKEDFAKHFFTVYNRLDSTKEEHDGKMPAYFRFLTLMAFHTFLEEKVDVAIMEVGIGGEYDCTNIIRKPVVVGISSLGVDHIHVLGDTVEKIAWHKAGIIKTGRPAFTVPQPENSIQVIQERAREKQADLHVVPDLNSYDFPDDVVSLGLAGAHQYLNATLALQLAKTWVCHEYPGKISFDAHYEPAKKQARRIDAVAVPEEDVRSGDVPVAEPFGIPSQFVKGLTSCYWPGRNQIVRRDKITYYLDGAHTPRSIAACCRWFHEKAGAEASQVEGPVARILIFNSTGDRDEFSLLPKLAACGFHGAAFCPNVVSLYSNDLTADTTNFTTTTERQMRRCDKNLVAFRTLLNQVDEGVSPERSHSATLEANQIDGLSHSHQHQTTVTTPPGKVDQSSSGVGQSGDGVAAVGPDDTGLDRPKLVRLPSIIDSLQWAACCKDSSLSSPSVHDPTPSKHAISANHIQVLVTGSIHLVGGVISILDPNLTHAPSSE